MLRRLDVLSAIFSSFAQYRAFAEKYYVDVKPTLIKAGLAKA